MLHVAVCRSRHTSTAVVSCCRDYIVLTRQLPPPAWRGFKHLGAIVSCNLQFDETFCEISAVSRIVAHFTRAMCVSDDRFEAIPGGPQPSFERWAERHMLPCAAGRVAIVEILPKSTRGGYWHPHWRAIADGLWLWLEDANYTRLYNARTPRLLRRQDLVDARNTYDELRAIVHRAMRRRLRTTFHIAIRMERKLQNADSALAKVFRIQCGLGLSDARGWLVERT